MSTYQLKISSKAKKDFRNIDKKVQQRIIKEILKLKNNRYSQQFKPLVGKKIAQFRLRIGDYRVLYDVYSEDEVVLILGVGHRKDIYR